MIIAILCFLFLCQPSRPICPPLHAVVVPKWVDAVQAPHPVLFKANGETYEFLEATTTVIDGKQMYQDGTTTDQDAIEYNKKVQECRIANGEF